LNKNNPCPEPLRGRLKTQQRTGTRFEKHKAYHFVGQQTGSTAVLADCPHLASPLENIVQNLNRQLSCRDQSL
jgi:hypothetical protein